MDIGAEIAARVNKLSPGMQEAVLRFVSSLDKSECKGTSASSLLQFAESLDDVSAREMMQAIEEECERVDASEW